MPNQPKTPNRSIRIDPGQWEQACGRLASAGVQASEVLRSFVAALAEHGLLNPEVETVIADPYMLAGLMNGVSFIDSAGHLYEVKTGAKGIRGVVRRPQIGVRDFETSFIGAFGNARLPVTVIASAPEA